MPIQWPPVDRGIPFAPDCDVPAFAPAWDVTNTGIIGADLSTDSLDPGIGFDNQNSRATNLRNLGVQFEPADLNGMAVPPVISINYGRQCYLQTDWYRSNSALAGITRDSTGAVLGLVQVDLFSSLDLVINRTVSDAAGNFTFSNPGTGPFYLIAYKPGAPDVAGTSVDTLLPTLI